MDDNITDFSNSIINFRVPLQGDTSPIRRMNFSTQMLDFLTYIDAATENATFRELFDVSYSLGSSGNNNSMDHIIYPTGAMDLLNILNTRNAEHDIMNVSMDDASRYKIVISDEGKESLKVKKYSDTTCGNESCPILRTNFEVGEEVTELPCGHCFDTEAINRWLQKEKAECPVCRFALKSKEIRKDDDIAYNNGNDNNDNMMEGIDAARAALFNSLSRTNQIIHPFGPRAEHQQRSHMTTIVGNEDHNELQEEILRSLRND